MGTRVEVDPYRINCPTCRARPGANCVKVVHVPLRGIHVRVQPEVILYIPHATRALAARQGRV